MTAYLFPDNTVLCNFAAVERLDLLRTVLDGRGRWTEAVAGEANKGEDWWPALKHVADEGWLGEPIEIDDTADTSSIEQLRRAVFGGTEDKPTRHLGEAQSFHVIMNWSEFAGSWWISDDKESLRYARGQGITVLETIDLVKIAVGRGVIEASDAFALMQRMFDLGRRPRLPAAAEELSR